MPQGPTIVSDFKNITRLPAPDNCHGDYVKVKGFKSAKAAYMDQAKKYLLAMNKTLGWISNPTKKSKTGIRLNPGGFAVAGEVYANFWNPANPDNGVFICISADYAQHGILYRRSTKVDEDGTKSGNLWLSYNTNSDELAHHIKKLEVT